MRIRGALVTGLACALAGSIAPAERLPRPMPAVSANGAFLPGRVRLPIGERLDLWQLDSRPHDLTSIERDPVTREPIFTSGLAVGFGTLDPVVGVETLTIGLYDFECTVHEEMTGQLEVLDLQG